MPMKPVLTGCLHPPQTLLYLKSAFRKTAKTLVADVAELADALDSKFEFHRFQQVSSRFYLVNKTIDFISRNSPLLRHWRVFF